MSVEQRRRRQRIARFGDASGVEHQSSSLDAAAAAVAIAVLAAVAVPACSTDDALVCEGQNRAAPKVYHGAAAPALVPLTAEQIAAIGSLGGCSGVAIAPTWVLTARHCELTAGATFCVGPSRDEADACAAATRVIEHPVGDVALVELAEPIPDVVPIPLVAAALSAGDIGRMAEAAGYGDTETGATELRRFVVGPLVGLPEDFAVIDGQGKRGTCFGDSGGPLLIVDAAGVTRVAGALTKGHSSCVGRSSFTRADVYRDWIEAFTGPTGPPDGDPGDGCGNIDREGRCAGSGAVALWCEDGAFEHAACEAGTRCGWDPDRAGFRCIRGADPCGGFDAVGGCDGATAKWCDGGQLATRDCAACGAVCSPFGSAAGAACVDDPCMGLDLRGRCVGDVAEWCEGDQLLTRDCAATGQQCGLISDAAGFFCL